MDVRHLLIVGRAGVGKTTLLKRLSQELRGQAIDGFLTEEVREDGQRLGFWLSSLDGRQALLAHRQINSPHRIGPYKVNVSVLDELAVGILRRAAPTASLIFLDELGRMELCSQLFRQAVEDVLVRGPRLVATAGVQHAPFLETLKHRRDVELIPLSSANRSAVLEELLVRLKALCTEDVKLQQAQHRADRICEMIVSGEVSELDIEIQQAAFRELVAKLLPDQQALYPLLFETRFHRLWQQFHR